MIEQTNTELIAKANAVSTNDVVANPRRYRTMIQHLAAALEKATRELEESGKDLEDESGRANDAVIAHNRATARAKSAEDTFVKIRDLPRYSVIEGDRAWSAVDADDLAAILDESASRPTPTGAKHSARCAERCNHCTVCGDGILYGSRCPEHYQNQPAEAPAPIETGERETLAAVILDESTPEYEVLAYLITAFRMRERELRGPITPELVKVSEPLADFLVANGFHRRPPVDGAEPVAYERRDRETGRSVGVVTARCLSESDRNCYDLTPLYYHPLHSVKNETMTINYCPEHGDLLSHHRSARCEEAHSIDEIRKTR